MQIDYIKLFSSNTDASNSIRGIYYQFLITLEKWLISYVKNDDSVIEIEVDDDIKEVANEIILTQVKSYSKSFSLNSIEIKKSLLNFYFNFLSYGSKTPLKFCFYTNTSIAKSEKLLIKWVDEGVKDDVFKKIVRDRIIKILKEQLKKKKNKLLNKSKEEEGKSLIKKAEAKFLADLTDQRIDCFVSCIDWKFQFNDPNPEIDRLEKSIRELLKKEPFKNVNIFVLERVMLSEIFRLSKLPKEKRKLTKDVLHKLIEKSEKELLGLLNVRFLNEINNKYSELERKLNEFRKDQIHLQKEINKRQVPYTSVDNLKKELTLLPIEPNQKMYGHQEQMKNFSTMLNTEHHINVYGFYGVGKTFFIKKYIERFYGEFDHIIWIDYSYPIENIIFSNKILIENLGLPINQYNTQEYIQRITYKLNEIKGNNILVLDNYQNNDSALSSFLTLRNWKTISTSKGKSEIIKNYKLEKIEFDELKTYFLHLIDKKQYQDDKTLSSLFEKVDFNPLILNICAKTIKNSLDLDINSLLERIENQKLNNNDLEIEFIEDNKKSESIIAYFYDKYRYNELSQSNSATLYFLSLLPSEGLKIEDLAMLGGKDFFEENKKHYINIINDLDRKGWIERNEDSIKMSKFLQTVIRHESQKNISPFVGNMFYINWLIHRIKEFLNTNPEIAQRYITIGESILKSIPHKHRHAIFQPLILLENEILYSYGVLFDFSEYEERWDSLIENAKANLSPNDPNLGVIYNNSALSKHEKDKSEEAIEYLNRSILIYKKNVHHQKFDIPRLLIISSINLSYHLFTKKYYKKLKQKLKYIYSLYKSFNKKEDYMFIVTLGINGDYHRELEEYDKAIELYLKAVELFHKLKQKDLVLNKVILCSILVNLIHCKLMANQDIDEHIGYIEKNMEDPKISEFRFGLVLIEAVIILFERIGKYDKAMKFHKILKTKQYF